MSAQNPANLDRLLELLATRAVEGLAETEATELDRLLREHPEIDPAGFERAAAAVWIDAGTRVADPMPAALKERIASAAPTIMTPVRTPPAAPRITYEHEDVPPARSRRLAPVLGWLAAAACLALAAVAWWPRLSGAPTAAERRERLLARADTRTIPIAAEGLSGDFVWREASDEGYLRVRGLPANDPGKEQYQVWVFDERLPGGGPMPAGVFDAGPGEIVVPLTPSLRVDNATTFAVSVERPGGAPTPDMNRVLLIAK